MVEARARNVRLVLEAATVTTTALGAKERTWATVGTVWAAVKAAPSRLTAETAGGKLEQPVTINVRYREDLLLPDHRLRDGTLVYEIQSPPVDPDGRRRELNILALVRMTSGTVETVP